MNNIQLEQYGKYIENFRGVFMKDTLPKKINKNESGIVNLNLNSQPGSHWVCYKKLNNNVYYFDSFGNVCPTKSLITYFKNCKIYYNYDRFQRYDQTNCGKLCLLFLLNELRRKITWKNYN